MGSGLGVQKTKTPQKKKQLYVTGSYVSKEPSVKYRGIFINDEDWGLQPWAAKTFEPETGDIGPKTYEKIFQLLPMAVFVILVIW